MANTDHNLPGIISAITPQKKNNERYSIFVNGNYLIGVDQSTLLKYKLAKGVEITPSLLRKLQQAEGRNAIKSYLLKILSRRDHARQELLRKARRKDYSSDIINDVIDELERKNFINEKRFSKKYARDKSDLNNWGPRKIEAHLRQKGVCKQWAEKAIHLAFESIDLHKRFQKLIQKRRRHFLREENAFKRKKKVFDYLQRKGYKPANIYKYLDELLEKLNNEKSEP